MSSRAPFVVFLLAAVTYLQNVKPILDSHCIECHSSGANVDLTSFPFIAKAPFSQPVIVNLMLAKAGAKPPQMPPGNRPKLTANELGTIQQWLDQGLIP